MASPRRGSTGGRVRKGRHPRQQSGPSSLQGPHQARLRPPLPERPQKVCQETPRARSKGAQQKSERSRRHARQTSVNVTLLIGGKKLEGQGCQASISYKTYFDTEEVRVCCAFVSGSVLPKTNRFCFMTDLAEHSHPVGLANLPFTRRGRRAAVEAEKAKSKRNAQSVVPPSTEASTSSSAASAATAPTPQPHVTTFPSSAPLTHLPHQFPHYPSQPGINPPYPQMVPAPSAQNEQWERMSVLFSSIREHARAYDYPTPSVVALESVLIRLYLESPMGMMGGPGLGALGAGMHGIVPPPQQQQGHTSQPHDAHSQSAMGVASGSGDHANSEMSSSISSG